MRADYSADHATTYQCHADGTRTPVEATDLVPMVFDADPVLGMSPEEYAAHVLHTKTIDRENTFAYCLGGEMAEELHGILNEAARDVLGNGEVAK